MLTLCYFSIRYIVRFPVSMNYYIPYILCNMPIQEVASVSAARRPLIYIIFPLLSCKPRHINTALLNNTYSYARRHTVYYLYYKSNVEICYVFSSKPSYHMRDHRQILTYGKRKERDGMAETGGIYRFE